jgi:hypothetical protein
VSDYGQLSVSRTGTGSIAAAEHTCADGDEFFFMTGLSKTGKSSWFSLTTGQWARSARRVLAPVSLQQGEKVTHGEFPLAKLPHMLVLDHAAWLGGVR